MAGGLVASFFASLGLDLDAASFAAGQVAVDAVEGSLRLLGEAAREAGALVAETVLEVVGIGDEAANASKAAGLSAQAWQELGFAADLANTDIQSLKQGLVFLQSAAADAAKSASGEAGKAFAALGVSVRGQNGQLKTSEQLLTEVAAAVRAFPDDPRRVDLVRSLFGRGGADLLPLLTEDLQGLREEARRSAIVLSDDLIQAGADLDDQFVRLRYAGRSFRLLIGAGLLPVVREAADAVLAWVGANRGLLSSAATSAVGALTAAAKALLSVFGALSRALLYVVDQWKFFAVLIGSVVVAAILLNLPAILAFAGAAISAALSTIAAWLAAAAPILAVGAAIAAVLLIAEDLYQFLTGGDSVIGRLLPDVEAFLAAAGARIRGAFRAAVDAVLGIFASLWNLLPGGFRTAITSVLSIYTDVFRFIAQVVTYYVTSAAGAVVKVFSAAAELLGPVFSALWEFFSSGFSTAAGVVQRIFDALVGAIRAAWHSFVDNAVAPLVDGIKSAFSYVDGLLGKLSGAASAVHGALGFGEGEAGRRSSLIPAPAPILAGPAAGSGASLQQRNDTTFVTYASPGQSPEEIASAQREQFERWQAGQLQAAALALGAQG